MSQQKEIGTLVVVVLKAQHLHQPSFYKQSPYVQASLSGLTNRTKVDPKGGQHPVWDDELRFPVLADVGKDKVNRILEISCYKDEQRGDDILLGKGTVNIEETLKTGEFDDWIPLETSAGARGEVYLEMTFYANSSPPLTRRPSKLSPSDRFVRPAAYYAQSRQSTPKSSSPITSPQPGSSPAAGERKPSQIPPTGGGQIPSSLIPAHVTKNQAPRQASPNGGIASVVIVKSRSDSLPPLPDEDDLADVGSGKNTKLPASLHPGGRSGPRPMPPQNRNRVLSTGRPPPETLTDQHHRTPSDTSALHVALPPPFSHLQTPMQSHSPEIKSTTGARAGLTPSIYVDEHVQDHPPLAFPNPLSPPTQVHESRGVYAAGDPGAIYVQPEPQAYVTIPMQGSPRTISPPQRPMPLQSRHTLPGQPPSHHQQYTQYPSASPTPMPLSLPQMYPQLQNAQSQLQPLSYSPQPQHSPHQQSYVQPQPQQYIPPPQQQHLQQQYCPQHLPYAQTPHPPQLPQPYQQHQHPGLPSSSQSPLAPQQPPPLYTQATSQPQQSYFTVPPPPPSVPSQTPQPNIHQQPHQPRSYFSPPPPPPPLYSQGGKGPSIPASVAQPSQTPAQSSAPSRELVSPPAALPQNLTPVIPLLQQPTTTPLPSQAVPITTPPSSTEEVVRRRQMEEGRNKTDSDVVAEAGSVLQGEVRETLEDVARDQIAEEGSKKVVKDKQGQLERLQDTGEQRVGEGIGCKEWKEEDRQQHEEELQKQEVLKNEECMRQQEVERREREEEERKRQEEQEIRKREEEEYRRREEERRRREDEERRRREVEEFKRREEERRVQEEEERRRREEEHRMREEERRREEERGRREEEERRRREEEESRSREEERRRQEEERIQREHEEAERRHKAAEEQARRRRAKEEEAERRWQEELARIRARAEQEAADAAFARAQWEADKEERRRQEEADLALVRQAQEEVEREEKLARDKRRQEEADMEVARREQAHEEELERRRQEERRKRMEDADRELARRLDMELNLGTESLSRSGDESGQRRAAGTGEG